jgi:hypothetical protein
VLNISRHCYLSKGLSAVPDLETRNFFLHTVELRCCQNKICALYQIQAVSVSRELAGFRM